MGVGSWVKHRGRLAGGFVRHGHLTARHPDRSATFMTSLPAVLQMAGVGLRPAAFDSIARSVGCPVLAISGERDSHVPASWIGGAARRYGWSHATIPGGSHFAHVDDPARWADAVEEWLAR
jgi:pimeloyl-ACP methyl ester carboxylesterase